VSERPKRLLIFAKRSFSARYFSFGKLEVHAKDPAKLFYCWGFRRNGGPGSVIQSGKA
jgi:hypothetical protein